MISARNEWNFASKWTDDWRVCRKRVFKSLITVPRAFMLWASWIKLKNSLFLSSTNSQMTRHMFVEYSQHISIETPRGNSHIFLVIYDEIQAFKIYICKRHNESIFNDKLTTAEENSYWLWNPLECEDFPINFPAWKHFSLVIDIADLFTFRNSGVIGRASGVFA